MLHIAFPLLPDMCFFCQHPRAWAVSGCSRVQAICVQILNCVGGQYLSGGWGLLEWGVRTGGPIFEKAYGEAFFEHCKGHPHLEENFSKAMTDLDHSCERQTLIFACGTSPITHWSS